MRELNPADFARIIARLKADTDVPITLLHDQIKKHASAEREGSGQGQPISFPDIDPWDHPVDAAALLDEIVLEIRRYVMLSEASAIAIALWVLHTYCYDVFEHSPRLVITSPEKQCGKTTLLDVLESLAARPLGTSNITAPAMFRTVEKYRPTLLIDEADTFLKDNEDMRGVVNSGHKRNGAIIRTVGDDFEPRSFSTFCPTAIAAIGSLPGTIEDRAVIVTLRRQLPDEARERFRSHKAVHLKDLVRKAVCWAEDSETALSEADPPMPKGLHNRAADNWTALLAIADCAGGNWPAKAREAGLELSQVSAEGASQSGGILLLRDIRTIFEARAASNDLDADRISSTELVAKLVGLPDRPWDTAAEAAGLTPRSPQEARVSAYIKRLQKDVEREAQDAAIRLEQTCDEARDRLTPLEDRLARLLATIPLEVQREGLALRSLQAALKGRWRGSCHPGELGAALRSLGFHRCRDWRGDAGFSARWVRE